jgi:hypothetical protein
MNMSPMKSARAVVASAARVVSVFVMFLVSADEPTRT